MVAVATNPSPRLRARKIRKPIGPFQTSVTTFDRGHRQIEIVRLTAHAIIYRLKGKKEEYTVGHEAAYLRAISAFTGFDTGPRSSTRISRGGTAL